MAKPVAIEELFQQIEAVVSALESGELPLEESLIRYEAGLKAMRQARGVLDRFAARLEELRGDEPPAADT
jgi:exodeoxyribonuclease VII small subunit